MARDKLLGVYWDTLQPTLHTRQHDQPGLVLALGIHLSLELAGARHCIGYYDESAAVRQLCRNNCEMKSGRESQCERCQHDGGVFTAKSGVADSGRGDELLDAQHDLYLALFGEDVIKVGVARSSRREVRLLEQAAHASIVIASGKGASVRVLERQIHREVGFPETLKMTTKLEKLATVTTPEEAQQLLLGAVALVRSHVKSLLPGPETDFAYHFPRYDVQIPLGLGSLQYIDRLDGGAVVSGRLVGALGRCLLLHNGLDDKVYALDSAFIEGYEAEIQMEQAPTAESRVAVIHTRQINLHQQGSLF